jgi:hypothetical protein
MGLSPTPIVHVSASPQCHPGRSDFPSPVGDHGISHTAFLMKARLKCLLTYTPNLISLLYDSWRRCRCPSYPGTVSWDGLLSPPPWPRAPLPTQGVTSSGVTSGATSEGITPPSSLLRAHASDQDPPASFSFRLVSRSLQVAASPCWEMAFPDVISTILV